MLMANQKDIDKIHDEVIARLKQERICQNLSQEALAEMAGLSRRGLGMIESGEIKPTFLKILRIASSLEIDFKKLI